MQRKTGVTAVGPAVMMGQRKGIKGLLRATQEYLGEKIVLSRIPMSSQKAYANWLDRKTELLLDAMQKKIEHRPWGLARKALNLFMRDAVYNKYLSKHFGLSKLESWLEVPLDSKVARGLKHRHGGSALPRWPGLKHLKSSDSQKFQEFAGEYAKTQNTKRVHLDIYLFLENR